ncbi:DUF2199 domain-containing protein [Streptomyces sp. NPDC059743]|uniref:DUF2199 domain-containing protein n=1 Tax=Streptomyces sp. NPDC059743 TaxID=3346928 RepID=UPI0036535333
MLDPPITTELPVYSPSTIGLKTHVHTTPVGERPFIELEPTDRPLAVERTARSAGGCAEPPGQLAEQILLIFTGPRHVAVRSQ